jgi:hypothetical protein
VRACLSRGFGTLVETVHLPLSPRGEVRSSPVILAKAHAILLRVTVARGMIRGRLDVTADVACGLAPRSGLNRLTFNDRLIDAHAQLIPVSQFDSTCQATALCNGGTQCESDGC